MPDKLGSLMARTRVPGYDTALGAGLVGSFVVLVLSTFWVAHPDGGVAVKVVVIGALTLLANVAAAAMPWARLPVRALLAFPVLVAASEGAIGLTSPKVAVTYVPFITLGFIFTGLTQPRWTSPALLPIMLTTWALAQPHWVLLIDIRLCITTVVWVVLAELLAARAASGRANTSRWMVRANSDGLTGLASRGFLAERLKGALSSDEVRGAVLLIDLDGLKRVNDTFGHAAGDELLVSVAERLRSSIRPDDIAARLGGDEFAVLLSDANLDTACQVAQRLLGTLRQPVSLSRSRLAVTASIGVVALGGQTAPEEALYEADVAMYEAKSSGRNHIATYRPEMQQRLAHRLELEAELVDALEQGRFEVEYQPILDVASGRFVGAEALVRWRHQSRGLLAPAEFIVAAEETGMILALGRWVLKQACAQAHSISPRAGSTTMAVNVSAPELYANDFAADVAAVLSDARLPASSLVLEITERLLMADPDLARQRLGELRALGARIAIDDFGTGYSSLAYLREFPVDILKIDRSFMSDLPANERSTALLRSILAMAAALGLSVVVEGVETPAQAGLLADLGCDMAQGYFFARPMPATDLSALLLAQNAAPSLSGTPLGNPLPPARAVEALAPRA